MFPPKICCLYSRRIDSIEEAEAVLLDRAGQEDDEYMTDEDEV